MKEKIKKKMEPKDFTYLDNEVLTSVKYIEYGLNEIKSLTGMPDSNHLAFYLLSNGFERLMKCIICFWEYKNSNEFPKVKRYGHNLLVLKKEIVKICYKMDYRKKCIEILSHYSGFFSELVNRLQWCFFPGSCFRLKNNAMTFQNNH